MPQLGTEIQALLVKHGLDETVDRYRAIVVWPRVVGDSVARNATAVRMEKSTLIVRAKTAAWRNEIAFQKELIIESINEICGSKIVKDIRLL